MIGRNQLLALLCDGCLAALSQLRGRLLGTDRHRLVAKRIRSPIGGFEFGAAETENADGANDRATTVVEPRIFRRK